MRTSPLVSVIVPIHDVGQYLEKCLNSLLAQTYQNIEIILVDDGSTDKSGEIANQFGKKDKRILTIHKKQGGVSSARNEGLKQAKGEWIVFVDSDDYVDKEYIAKLQKLALETNADIATCSFSSFSIDGSSLKKKPTWPEKTLTGIESINYMFKNKYPAYVWLSIYKADLFKKNAIVFPEGKTYEDITTKINLMYNAKRVAYTNERLYHYQIRKNSITGEGFTKTRFNDYSTAIQKVRTNLEATPEIESFTYLNYFEFSSLITLANYIAREPKKTEQMKTHWQEIRKKLKAMRSKTMFPSTKTKLLYTMAYLSSSNIEFYSAIYRKAKR